MEFIWQQYALNDDTLTYNELKQLFPTTSAMTFCNFNLILVKLHPKIKFVLNNSFPFTTFHVVLYTVYLH
jgi:hypothetical protein